MSGTASVPNSFAAAVTATGAQLDANYSTIVSYVNDPTNRNNYAAGGAATNTVALTFAPPVVGGYTAGLELTWKWGVTNTGAVVANANGLGDINVVNSDGSALQSGQGVAGSIGKAVYDGTRAIFLAPPSPATKAAMETATASATFVTPAQAGQHPAVAKAWASFNGTNTGTITALSRYNIASIVRTGTGTYSVAYITAFATTAYQCVSSGWSPGVRVGVVGIGTRAVGGCLIHSFDAAGSFTDLTEINFSISGALA